MPHNDIAAIRAAFFMIFFDDQGDLRHKAQGARRKAQGASLGRVVGNTQPFPALYANAYINRR